MSVKLCGRFPDDELGSEIAVSCLSRKQTGGEDEEVVTSKAPFEHADLCDPPLQSQMKRKEHVGAQRHGYYDSA